MSDGVKAYYDKMEEKYLNSKERSDNINEVLISEDYKKYLVLKDKFKEYEEYLLLREKFKKLSLELCYNL